MSSELVYRMRTCSAALLDCDYSAGSAPRDAADLLAEASNILDMVDDTTAEVLEALEIDAPSGAVWTTAGELPAAVPQPCPSCGLISARTARITNTKLLLTCPMCSHEWEYAP